MTHSSISAFFKRCFLLGQIMQHFTGGTIIQRTSCEHNALDALMHFAHSYLLHNTNSQKELPSMCKGGNENPNHNAEIPKTKRFALCIDDSYAQTHRNVWEWRCLGKRSLWNAAEWSCPPHVNTTTRATHENLLTAEHLRKCDFDSQRHFSTTTTNDQFQLDEQICCFTVLKFKSSISVLDIVRNRHTNWSVS